MAIGRFRIADGPLWGDGPIGVAFGDGVTLAGGPGNDTLRGGTHDDMITGEAGDDRLYGFAGADMLYGGSGRDMLGGGDGDDSLDGGGGDDTLVGGDGDDMLVGGAGDDRIDGGAGNDRAIYAISISGAAIRRDGDAVIVTTADGTDRLTLVETLVFADGSIRVSSLGSDNTVFGSRFDDFLAGTNDRDGIIGYDGDDRIQSMRRRRRPPQFFDLSTILPAVIQGIMPRSPFGAPTVARSGGRRCCGGSP
jgi:Ca2+-binding RTX toxin-like protein